MTRQTLLKNILAHEVDISKGYSSVVKEQPITNLQIVNANWRCVVVGLSFRLVGVNSIWGEFFPGLR